MAQVYFESDLTPREYRAQLKRLAYGGFNLRLLDREELWCGASDRALICLESCVYGLSNATLDTPWFKATAVKAA